MKLELQKFIEENKNWEELLSEKPYALDIKRDGDYILFKYSQIDSDFNLEIVKEARGIIFYEPTWEVVCYPFKKFFNVQESYADNVDWNTATVLEKIDGSIIKLWHHNDEWHVSTNGTIDANKALFGEDLSRPDYITSFEDLFWSAENNDLVLESLDTNFVYIFELVSPYNRIVVPHQNTMIFHIGTRDMRDLQEVEVDIWIEKPVQYNISNLNDCLIAVRELPFDDEGYVVVDGNYNRVKIKSPQYLAAHHLRGEGNLTMKRVVEMCLITNEQSEFLSYFPEYRKHFEEVIKRITDAQASVDEFIKYYDAHPERFETRKDFALVAKEHVFSAYLFAWYDGKFSTIEEWLRTMRVEYITKALGF